ncbi:MAG: DUF3006 domain-containing protein [bacterium]
MYAMSTISAFIDAIDEGVARLLLGDDGAVVVRVPVSWLPEGVKPGMALQVTFTPDMKQTLLARDEVGKLLDELGRNNSC